MSKQTSWNILWSSYSFIFHGPADFSDRLPYTRVSPSQLIQNKSPLYSGELCKGEVRKASEELLIAEECLQPQTVSESNCSSPWGMLSKL